MSKKLIVPILKMVLGVSMIVLAIIAYASIPQDLIEMTFVSNFCGGAVLLADGILCFKNKSISSIVYRNLAVCLFFVFIICTGSLFGAYNMNFKGAFFALHTVFPILFILMYIFFVDDRNGKLIIKLVTTPILMIVYLLFDYILGNIRGNFVYGFFTPNELTFLYALLTGLVFYLLLGIFGWFFIGFNKLTHPIKDNDKKSQK